MSQRETDLNYATYLRISELLSLQRPITTSDHELPFIVVHQCAELFFKAALSQLQVITDCLDQGKMDGVASRIERLTSIMRTVVCITHHLESLTPQQFAEFREALGTASGAQSSQFRAIEAKSKDLADKFVAILKRWGLLAKKADEEHYLEEELITALRRVYEERRFTILHEIAEAIYDYDDAFADFRWQHLKVARRAIGHARGTGGSKGIDYLYSTLSAAFFPELTKVHTELISVARTLPIRYEKP